MSSHFSSSQWNVEQVAKRDGRMVPFDQEKVISAIFRAARSVGGSDKVEAERLSVIVCKKIVETGKRFPTVEEIQDIVEKVLIDAGHAKTAKAFILYRAKRTELRNAAAEAARGNDKERVALLHMFAHKSKLASLIGYDRLESYKNLLFYIRDLQKSGKLPTDPEGKYLSDNEMATSFYERKYYLKELSGELIEKRPEDLFARLASFVAAVEPDEKRQKAWAEEFYTSLYEGYFMPGGRVIAGAGDLYRLKTLANCFVSLMEEDNLESIYKVAYECARTYSHGGGIGVDISPLRPAGAVVHNAADNSTGAVSFMELYSLTTGLIGQSGRRGALMITLDIKHPDSPLFINIKKTPNWTTNQISERVRMSGMFSDAQLSEIEKHVRENTQVRSANISLKMNDEFMRAIEEQNEHGPDAILVYEKDRSVSSRGVAQGGEVNYAYGIPSKPIEQYTLQHTFSSISELNAFLSEQGNSPLTHDILAGADQRDMFGDYIVTLSGSESDFAIKYAGDFMLYFNSAQAGEIKNLIKARDRWDKFVSSKYNTAEPGLLFWTNMERFSPSNYVGRKIVSTNPCGEVPLEDGGACNLGSINLSRFVQRSYTENAAVDWDNLAKTAHLITRFLDNVTTWNEALNALEKQRKAALETRRIGVGVMGIADMLNQLQISYDSDEGAAMMERVMKFIANHTYRASAELSEEKGPASVFDYDSYARGEFFQKNLEEKTQEMVHEKGLRNIALLSIAPTGTISNIILGYRVGQKNYIGVSGGIEPIFSLFYQRRTEGLSDGTHNKVFRVFHGTVEAYVDQHGLKEQIQQAQGIDELKKVLPEYFFKTAHFIAPDKRVEIQGVCQQYVDHSISSTVNLAEDIEPEVISNIYLDAWKKGLKGITVYRDGSRFAILTVDGEKTPFHEYKGKSFIWNGKSVLGTEVISLPSGRLTTPFHAVKDGILVNKDGDILEEVEREKVSAPEEVETISEFSEPKAVEAVGFTAIHIPTEISGPSFVREPSFEPSTITASHATLQTCPSCGKNTLKMENGCNACTDVGCGFGTCE